MSSSFVSDFFPEHLVRRFFPKHRTAAASKIAHFHLRNIYVVPTQAGFGLIGIILLTLVAAINFQNSLIYIVSFWLGSLLLVNVLYSYRNLNGLQLELLGPEPCFAGQQCLVSLRASGRGDKESIYIGWKEIDLAMIDLAVVDKRGGDKRGGDKRGADKRGPGKHEATADAAGTLEFQVAYPAPMRGRLQPPRLDVFTRYPAGLVVSWAYARLDIQAIVYPHPQLMDENQLIGRADESAEEGRELAGGVSDFSGMRPYQEGDSPRRIHWAKYAQTGKLYSKVFVDYEQHDLWLDWATLTSATIEQRLSHLCARVLQLSEQQQRFGLRLPGKTLSPDTGGAHRAACLTALALYPHQGACRI